MHRRRPDPLVIPLLAASTAFALANGCGSSPNISQTTSPGSGGHTATGSSSTAGMGGDLGTADAGGSDAAADGSLNACALTCGPVELCDPEHLGLDDNCNGQVDEGCTCNPGEVHACFKGDPAYRGTPGCFDGTEVCDAQGLFGDCLGGVHAAPPDDCHQTDPTKCHAIRSAPFATVKLAPGTGTFSGDAVPGSESYAVTCPPGASKCPAVVAPDGFKPIQSGEYTVTYTKQVAGDPNPRSCTFPLEVGARGLRVELTWEHTTNDTGVDLDLHLHQPMSTAPWTVQPGVPQDCGWSNCVLANFAGVDPSAPHWFAASPAMPPAPVDWDDDTTDPENNTCYFAPRGAGPGWQSLGKGCHNPRLDTDNIQCDYTVTDPDDPQFCTPENINIDYPPSGQWMRLGVNYYSNRAQTYDVHPRVKVFCDGALAADLGPSGFYQPESPVTFHASDGAKLGANPFWLVADVAFTTDACNRTRCTVEPLYLDPLARTPYFSPVGASTTPFSPPYPPLP